MWRVVKCGGLLVICQTGNGLIPGGPHSSRWWSNVLPHWATEAGHKRGITYSELWRVLGPLGCSLVMPKDNQDTELARWRARHWGYPTTFKQKLLRAAFLCSHKIMDRSVTRIFGLPISVFMPYLNLAFRKDCGAGD
jgi:hypothetical protein